jgi:hypothetical protein
VLDPVAQIKAYHFGLAFFAKEPSVFPEINPHSWVVQKKLP